MGGRVHVERSGLRREPRCQRAGERAARISGPVLRPEPGDHASYGVRVSVQTLERLRPRTIEPAPDVSARARRWPLALGGLVCVAALYHWLQSLGHVTPAVFTDELMFAELARSIVGGDGLTVRGEEFPFPAIVPAVVQAPAWLLGGTAYETVKALNAVLMSLAVVPAWFLARILLRPVHAFAVATATVATGGMLYHSYLTSEAVAYPVFLVAAWAMVAAIGEPSKRRAGPPPRGRALDALSRRARRARCRFVGPRLLPRRR